MISEGKIGPSEASAIPTVLLCLNALFAGSLAADYGLNACWLVLLIAGGLTFVGIFFSAQLMNYYPDKSIVEVSRVVLGPIPGFLVGIIFLNLFLLGSVLFLRLETDRILTVYLPNTPEFAMSGALVIAGIIGAYIGLEALARTAKILIIFIIISIILPLIMAYNFWNWNNLFPLGGSGLVEITEGGLSMSGMYVEIIILAVIYPSIKIASPRALWYPPLLTGVLVNTLVALFSLLIFSIPALNETIYPVVQSARLIYLGRFIQRIDIFFAFFWMIAITLKFTFLFYATNVLLTRLLKLPYRKPFLIPLGIIVSSLSFIPNNIIESLHLISDIAWRWNGLLVFSLMLFMLLVHYLKPQKSSAQDQKRGQSSETT